MSKSTKIADDIAAQVDADVGDPTVQNISSESMKLAKLVRLKNSLGIPVLPSKKKAFRAKKWRPRRKTYKRFRYSRRRY